MLGVSKFIDSALTLTDLAHIERELTVTVSMLRVAPLAPLADFVEKLVDGLDYKKSSHEMKSELGIEESQLKFHVATRKVDVFQAQCRLSQAARTFSTELSHSCQVSLSFFDSSEKLDLGRVVLLRSHDQCQSRRHSMHCLVFRVLNWSP